MTGDYYYCYEALTNIDSHCGRCFDRTLWVDTLDDSKNDFSGFPTFMQSYIIYT